MTTDIANDSLVAEFCEEALDALDGLPEVLTRHEGALAGSEAIDAVFRAVHTVKGNAGFFGMVAIQKFAHVLEDALDDVRQGRRRPDATAIRQMAESLTVLEELLVEVQQGQSDVQLTSHQEDLLAAIRAWHKQGDDASTDSLPKELCEIAGAVAALQDPDAHRWSERLMALAMLCDSNVAPDSEQEIAEEAPSAATLLQSNFEHEGRDVTEQLVPLIRAFEQLDADEGAQRAFLEAAESVAQWAADNNLEKLAACVRGAKEQLAMVMASPLDLDDTLIAALWEPIVAQLIPLLVPSAAVAKADAHSPSSADAARNKADGDSEGHAKNNRFLRVREDYVEGFLESVSDLFITCERLKELQQRMSASVASDELVDELRHISATLSEQSNELQKGVVELRKVPIRTLFSKCARAARSLASKLHKQINVELVGEDIDVDKSLLEDLDGPLMHMVRNVVDHGIEHPEEREAREVPPAGTLELCCSISKTHVQIKVRDDGRGICPRRLRDKAVEKGLMSREQAESLTDQEAVELVFHPGFSTAEKISDVSGRGVGLDVVRTRVQEYDGTVRVESQVGVGTTFYIDVPIRRSVVVIDGLLVQAAESVFAIPFDAIHEIIAADDKDASTVHGRPVVRVRGEPFAAAHLSELLRLSGSHADCGHSDGVLVSASGKSLVILVDRVLGHRKLVVTDIPADFATCDPVAGVTQLGGGRLALILNTEEILTVAHRDLNSK